MASKVGISDCKNEQEGWILTTWSDQQWVYVFRHSDSRIRAYIAAQAIAAAKNDKIGYGVVDRTTFWDNLLVFGFRAAKITVPCSADHASSVAALVRGAGTIMNDAKILSHVLPNMTARTAQDMLVRGGFSYTNQQGYVLSDGYLKAGDILWKPSHMCIVTGNGAKALENSSEQNGLSQFLDTVKSHMGEGNGWTRAMLGKDALLPNQAWDAAYISACAKQNGLTDVAFVEATNGKTLIDGSVKKGLGKYVKGPADGDSEAVPKVGDVVAFTYKEGQEVSHVGVVTNVHKDDVTVVAGDVSDSGGSSSGGGGARATVVGSSTVKKSFKSIRGYYRPSWKSYGIDGGSYDPGDWIGESLADLYYDRDLALLREVGYTDDGGSRSLHGGKYRLSVVNYTQLLERMGVEGGSEMGGLNGLMEGMLSGFDLAELTELKGVGGIQEQIARVALDQLGKPYVYGAKGETAFDCSGLVAYAYNKVGINIGAGTSGILDTGKANKTIVMDHRNYNASNLAIGDLIVTTSAQSDSGRHVTIYVGNGKVVSASGKEVGVVTRNVTTNSSSVLGVVRPLLKVARQ